MGRHDATGELGLEALLQLQLEVCVMGSGVVEQLRLSYITYLKRTLVVAGAVLIKSETGTKGCEYPCVVISK
jgi:hypothetical protein